MQEILEATAKEICAALKNFEQTQDQKKLIPILKDFAQQVLFRGFMKHDLLKREIQDLREILKIASLLWDHDSPPPETEMSCPSHHWSDLTITLTANLPPWLPGVRELEAGWCVHCGVLRLNPTCFRDQDKERT